MKSLNKKKKLVPVGIAHVRVNFNNTLIAISTLDGGVIASSSAGANGFKGARKSTPYAAQMAAEQAARKALELGMKTMSIQVQGPGAGRDSAVKALAASGINITSIKDVTPVPHNGCRPPKRRRV